MTHERKYATKVSELQRFYSHTLGTPSLEIFVGICSMFCAYNKMLGFLCMVFCVSFHIIVFNDFLFANFI